MRYTKHDLALNKYNVLGRGEDRGDIELHLGITFTAEERALAGRVINSLVDSCQLEPTYTDSQSPENWLTITDQGERVLQTEALDDLDMLLINLNASADLLQLRYGTYDAIASQNTDWQRHAATSCRELITKVLHAVSPDDEVQSDLAYKPNAAASNGITRRERVKHYLRRKQGRASQSDTTVIEKAADLIDACYQKLSVVTHTDAQEVETLIKLTEDALYFLLK
jgi:hypothetical protein